MAFIKGNWCSSQNDMYNVDGLDNLAIGMTSDFIYIGETVEYNADLLPIPQFKAEDYLNANRLLCDEMKALMFIPLSNEKMYIYCYSNNTIDEYKRL